MIASIRAVSSLIASVFILMSGFGLANYVVPLRALGEGWTATDIALIGAVYSAGYTLASFITPKFIRLTGHIRVFAANIALMVVSILLCALVADLWAWMAFRGMFGFAIASCYLIMESWINEKAENEYRGFMFSVYMVTAMGGTIAGPYIASLGDVMNTALFIVAAIILASAVFPVALSASSTPTPPTEVGFDLKSLWRRSPVAFVGTFLSGVIAGAWLNFAAVFAKMSGLTETGGANLIAAITVGAIVAQFPLGRVSDHVDRRAVMVFCCILGVIAGLWMFTLDARHEYQLYMAACLSGMVMFPIYSLNVAHANDMALPGEFVRISSGITVLYGVGVILGPLIGGQAIANAGARGLPMVLAVFFAIYGVYATWRILRRPAKA
ncbi:MFS transporter [Rhizobium sp. LjRoot254]|uniref:MFS transporter n=1 Tax=Rhizobium sp. LjRoot254 TaxID=3342297 RepID=UPI003ECD9033